jgi:hypothetical protein
MLNIGGKPSPKERERWRSRGKQERAYGYSAIRLYMANKYVLTTQLFHHPRPRRSSVSSWKWVIIMSTATIQGLLLVCISVRQGPQLRGGVGVANVWVCAMSYFFNGCI